MNCFQCTHINSPLAPDGRAKPGARDLSRRNRVEAKAASLHLARNRGACLAAFQLGAAGALTGVGWCGLILTPFSIYGGPAFLVEDVNQRTIVPVFRRGPAKKSLEGNFSEQVEHVEQEAVVRNPL
jgi:hypothetical protein